MEYLCQKYALGDHWYPRDLRGRARVDEYTHWHHTFTRFHAASLFRELLMSGEPNSQEVEKLERYNRKVTQHLDKYYLKDHDFLCGNEISIADILCICELTQLYAVGKESLYMDNPKVAKWVDRVKRACGPSFDESHKLINRVRDSYLKRQKTASKM
ncbi:hypothetical protein FSP39_011299 [Pinctada imbricata]|uniref:GST C-terminal domain-containing protein n=1 Tax=Pinctada imbricata TaxID=66713 RepID=A0AA88XFU6_PINIB|nr:hypothetical protein FSP39_011299 [Pinctada imbricata]